MNQQVHVIFNSASGSYSCAKAEKILKLLHSAGLEPRPLLPDSVDDARQKIESLCKQFSKPVIIAVGGDGTINTVINCMQQGEAILGVIPLGTANVMARELGIRSVRDAVGRIARCRTRSFSVGEVRSALGLRRFVLMAGIGLDAAAVADVRSGEKRMLGKVAYVMSGLRQIIGWDKSQLTVSCNQQKTVCNSVVIANASHYAGPYLIAPQASLFSKHLVAVPLCFNKRFDFYKFACSILLKGRFDDPSTVVVEQGVIKVEGEKPVQLDGDSFGSTPIEVRLISEFNKLIY